MDREVEDLELEPDIQEDEPSHGPSVREALESAWEKHRDEPKPEPELVRRDAKPDKAPSKTPAAPKPAAAAKDSKPAATAGDTSPRSEPPQGWSNEAKTEWAKLPPHVQAAVTKREADMTAGAKQLQARYGGIHKAVTDLGPIFQKLNVTPDKGFENMVGWFRAIETNPAQAIAALAKTYNVNLGSPGSTEQPKPIQTDPRLDQLLTKVQTIESAEAERRSAATNERLKAWASTKPHFEAVRGAMAQIVSGAAATGDTSIMDANGVPDLDKVYDIAIWQVPEVRAAILKEQQAAELAARRTQTTQARRAGASIKPRPPGDGSNGQKPGLKKGASVRDSIVHALSELRDS